MHENIACQSCSHLISIWMSDSVISQGEVLCEAWVTFCPSWPISMILGERRLVNNLLFLPRPGFIRFQVLSEICHMSLCMWNLIPTQTFSSVLSIDIGCYHAVEKSCVGTTSTTIHVPIQYQIKRHTYFLPSDSQEYLANIFQGRIEYELIYSLRGAKHRVDYSVHIRWDFIRWSRIS